MASQSKKYKAACDQCHNSKVKCPGEFPTCKRCADVALPCQYTLAARVGKPPGSKNKKTRERIRQANRPDSVQSEGCMKDDIAFSSQSSNNIHSPTAFNVGSTSQRCNETQRLPQDIGSPATQRSSSSMASLDFPNCQQFPTTAALEHDGGLNMDLSIFDEQVIGSSTTNLPSFEEVAHTESHSPWTDRSEKPWTVSRQICYIVVASKEWRSHPHRVLVITLFRMSQVPVSFCRMTCQNEGLTSDRSAALRIFTCSSL